MKKKKINRYFDLYQEVLYMHRVANEKKNRRVFIDEHFLIEPIV